MGVSPNEALAPAPYEMPVGISAVTSLFVVNPMGAHVRPPLGSEIGNDTHVLQALKDLLRVCIIHLNAFEGSM